MDLSLIGIGSGNPDHLTLQAVRALTEADLVLIPRKGADKADLADLRHAILNALPRKPPVVEVDLPERDPAIADYATRVDRWHDAIARCWATALRDARPGGTGRVAVMVWGDPSLYDSSLRIAARVADHLPLTVRVVPGITAVQALCAAHAMPLNTVGAPVTITTGRQLRERGWGAGPDTLVVMLDGDCAFTTLDPAGVHIAWTAFAGMAQEVSIAGPLAEVGPRILAARAAARADHGWIMDTYRLQRGPHA
ncbi:precorrin-6A synthase (deacetylating) [Falsirhodobacter halotolerans]|uniref:precorrin-6A synthase (deacetylating) n=1 Tax=Falsirhodobacter halotolerans TaxID=1146892 RepID=UPI001FD61FB1|nr:precorrin-6A synthase (deacetylating) [Falsirhodobacter halotolerans]MCJ8139010.1 precorrin-6A synthase (deacetylating) [Falsirhodobacter halotolerans]